MCTVTYLPLGKNNFILTSNRDEDPTRKTVAPKMYLEDQVELTYPKDELAGGTWIGLSSKKRLICLLNGGFTKHQRALSYKMSRGMIVKHLLKVSNAVLEIDQYNFNGIEPFTIVLVDWNKELSLYELVWDGNTKHFKKLEQEPKIWSSATLYTEEMRELRQIWFANWLKEKDEFTQENIVAFHQDTSKGTPETSLKMKRSTVETVSTTCVAKDEEKVSMSYFEEGVGLNGVSDKINKVRL